MRAHILLLLSLVALAACLSNGYAATLTPAEEMIVKVLESGRLSGDRRSFIPPDISLVPPEQREAVIFRLRETAKLKGGNSLLGTVALSTMEADLLLLRLGDTFTIERMVKDYRAYDGMTSWGYVTESFRYARQPKIIPYLADDFCSKEDPNKGITVSPPPGSTEFAVGVPARSIFSGVMVTDLIKSSPAFSPQMKAWANRAFALRLESPERFRGLMRAWWDVNKTAFERGDYLAVIPVAEEDAAPATPPASTPKQEPSTHATPPAPPALVTPTSAIPAERKFPVWPWIVGVAVAIGIVALAAKRRSL